MYVGKDTIKGLVRLSTFPGITRLQLLLVTWSSQHVLHYYEYHTLIVVIIYLSTWQSRERQRSYLMAHSSNTHNGNQAKAKEIGSNLQISQIADSNSTS